MSRTALLAGFMVLVVSCQPSPTESTNTQGDAASATFIFDGDSFEIDGGADEVRMLGINAPESDECFGDEARDALVSVIEGQELVLVRDSSGDRDRFGRLLRYVFVGGQNVNEAMLSQGNAIVVQGDHDLNDEFVETVGDAAEGRRGLWAPEVCGPSSDQDIRIAWVESDPPGPDDEALNDEYVRIVHEGTEAVDMTGWTLRDESTSNRYVFARQLSPGEQILVRTGCGDDEGESVYWCSERSIWSNAGDTAMLQDEKGNVVSWRTYESG